MISYVKSTTLLLFLLCVTKLIQAEHAESTDELKSSDDSTAVEHTESSTLISLDGVDSTTENVEGTTKNSTNGGEEEKESALPDETKTAEKRKSSHTLRQKRSISHTKRKYKRSQSQDSSEDSGTDKSNSNSNSSEPSGSDEDKVVLHEDTKIILHNLKNFLDDSCVFTETYDILHNTIKEIVALLNNHGVEVLLNPDNTISFLANFKDIWEEYCGGHRTDKDALTFFSKIVSKITKFIVSCASVEEPDYVSRRSHNSLDELKDALDTNNGTKRGEIGSLVAMILEYVLILRPLGLLKNLTEMATDSKRNDAAIDLTSLHKYENDLDLSPHIQSSVRSLINSLAENNRSDDASPILDEDDDSLNLGNGTESVLTDSEELESEPDLNTLSKDDENPSIDSEGTEPAKRTESKEPPTLEDILRKYCELRRQSSDILTTLEALLKEFHIIDEPSTSQKRNDDSVKFLKSLKTIVDKNGDVTKRSGFEVPFISQIIDKYCEGFKRSSSALASFSKVLVPQEGDNTKRSTLLSQRKLLDEYIDGSKRSLDALKFFKSFMPRLCENIRQSFHPGDKRIDFQKTHTKEYARSKVRTNSDKIHSNLEERKRNRREYDDVIGWRHGVFEPDQRVSKTQTEKSSPRIIKKSKVRRLKKPKNLKNRLINLYNRQENGTRTRGHSGQFAKPRIIGHNENPPSSFEVKAGVERDMGSKDSTSRFRCNVRTKASISDAEGRTGSSKGYTFSEIPSNDTKVLLCSSETSEVHRPNKDVYIKESVSGKSVVSYDNPDKYIRHNYSPSKENLEIGTSGFSALNDTSSKNQSVSVVSTDSQNADSISRSETKFVQGEGDSRGMESSGNAEGSIDVVPNKNPFITNSRQHSLGMVVENPDKNMENPLPVEKNEKLQTYSKFQRTEDFDINFRKLEPERSRPESHHRRRSR